MKKIKQERYKLSKEARVKYEKVLSTFLKEQKAKKDAVKKDKEEVPKAATAAKTAKPAAAASKTTKTK